MDASVFEYRYAYYQAQLRGLLHDICEVYVLLRQGGQQVKNDENTIRDEFGKYFEDQAYKETTTTAKYYFFESEGRLQKTAGRVDMRFLSPNCYGRQDEFFASECKRLDGNRHLCKEYVDNGVRRFTSGKYPSLLGSNAMLGFVVSPIDLGMTVNSINSFLNQTEHLYAHNATTGDMAGFESQHTTPYKFILYHLWMDFSGLVTA